MALDRRGVNRNAPAAWHMCCRSECSLNSSAEATEIYITATGLPAYWTKCSTKSALRKCNPEPGCRRFHAPILHETCLVCRKASRPSTPCNLPMPLSL